MTDLEQARSLALRLYAALRSGDEDGVRAVVTDDLAGHAAPGMPGGLGGDHTGADAMIHGFWWPLGRLLRVAAEPDETVLLADGRLLVRGHYRGRARDGAPLDAEFVHVLTIGGDRVTALEQLTDTAAWHQALSGTAPLETIDYRVHDGVAHVRLNRPEQRNAINGQMADDLLVVARRIEGDPRVRAVLISGAGPSLSVGGDISHFQQHGGDDLGALFRSMTTPYHDAFRILARVDAPIVTAAHGAVAGGALAFVYAADLCVLAEGTRLVTAFADLAVSGDGGSSWHLPRRIGAARAARALLLNRPISSQEALDWGLVADVVPADELAAHTEQLAARLASGPTRTYGTLRRLQREGWDRDLGTALTAETDALEATGRTRDAHAAIDAFLNRTTPTFQGR